MGESVLSSPLMPGQNPVLYSISKQLRSSASCLKLDLRFQLDHAGGNIASKTRSQDASRWHLHRLDLSKRRVRTGIIGRAEIRVIEKIKELKTETQHYFVATDDARVLHDREVGIEIARR